MANSLKLLLVAPCLLWLAACVGPAPAVPWPAELPPRSLFQQQWRADAANRDVQTRADYLMWVLRFYQGYNLVPGWLGMMEQVRSRVPDPQWRSIEPRLWQLGQLIGGEWAKDNSVRKLNTRAAAVWRDALLEALSRQDLDNYLQRLEQDVAALLAGQLDGDSIRFERYYTDEFDF